MIKVLANTTPVTILQIESASNQHVKYLKFIVLYVKYTSIKFLFNFWKIN